MQMDFSSHRLLARSKSSRSMSKNVKLSIAPAMAGGSGVTSVAHLDCPARWRNHRFRRTYGLVTTLATNTMEVLDQWGGNGPGAFNMPYGIEVHHDEIWIVSTFNKTLFRANNRKVMEAWRYGAKQTGDKAIPWKLDATGYRMYLRDEETIQIRGECYLFGYGRLIDCDDSSIVFPDLFVTNENGHIYFTQGVRGNHGAFIFSPQNPRLHYFSDDGGCDQSILMDHDMWAINGQIYDPHLRLDHLKLEGELRRSRSNC